MQECKTTLPPLPFLLDLFYSVKTTADLKSSPWVGIWCKMGTFKKKTKKQQGVHLFKLKRIGTYKGVMTWFSTWYLGKGKEAQGVFSERQVIQAPSLFQEALQGMIPVRTCDTFWAWAEETKYPIFLLPSALPWNLVPVLQRGQQEQEGAMTGRCSEHDQEQEFSASCQ